MCCLYRFDLQLLLRGCGTIVIADQLTVVEVPDMTVDQVVSQEKEEETDELAA